MIPLNSLQYIHLPYFTTEFIQNIELSSIFSTEFIFWIHNDEIKCMNSDWIQWILISEFISLWIHIWIQNPYIWIHIHISYTHEFVFHFIYEFRCIWIHIVISHMNSYNDYISSYVYEFTYMNSYGLWIHMIFSYMNSYVSWIHIWIRMFQGSRCTNLKNKGVTAPNPRKKFTLNPKP